MKTLSFLLSFILLASFGQAQNAKKFFKTGETFSESQQYNDALDNFTKAIEMEPDFVKAFVARADVYIKLNKTYEAFADLERACILDAKEPAYSLQAARLALALEKYESAIKFADLTILNDKKLLDSYHIKVMALFNLNKIDEALFTANAAIEIKKIFQTHYDKAEMLFARKEYKEAQNYYQLAISDEENNIKGYIGLANAYFQQNLFDPTISSVNSALRIDQRSKDAYLIRAAAYNKKFDYVSAINDLSQVIVLYPNEPFLKDVFFKRGQMYYDFKQHINAINDYTSVIDMDPQYYPAYFNRAASYEEIHSLDKAILDYEKLDALNLKDEVALKLLDAAHIRLFELKREDNRPVLVINNPMVTSDKKIQIILGKETQQISGQVNDESPIKSFTINGTVIQFDSTSKKNEFNTKLVVKDKTEIVFAVRDVYDNVTNEIMQIQFTEVDAPELSLVQPMASDDGQIYLQSSEAKLYIEGTIIDASLIASILIDSAQASFIPSTLNPSFGASVNITNKNQISIEVKDIFGNTTTKKYILNREGAEIASENPMGKTWVIFIENAQYSTFASLNGPTKDVSMMKSALANYNINNIIHKRNLTKSQMEKFFSIELRDLVIKNNVNSIIVWYAGHGKFLNNTGYWVPVDGRTDDEFTYFNISTLKSSMQAYSKIVTHTLVITDACESGPSFYQAMRSDITERDCSDWKATKFKSSQVFSSAGYELASDNSQFTKTFANSLIHNPNTCIPIESIVLSVKKAVTKNNQQAPQFGKIDGMEDENGTFFFIRK